MNTPSRSPLVLVVPILAVAMIVGGCASTSGAGAETIYRAPTNQNVISSLQALAGRPEQEIIVQNLSSVPIVVHSFTLRNCQNVRNACEPTPVRVEVAPGNRVRIALIRPVDGSRGAQFGWSVAWQARADIPPLP